MLSSYIQQTNALKSDPTAAEAITSVSEFTNELEGLASSILPPGQENAAQVRDEATRRDGVRHAECVLLCVCVVFVETQHMFMSCVGMGLFDPLQPVRASCQPPHSVIPLSIGLLLHHLSHPFHG